MFLVGNTLFAESVAIMLQTSDVLSTIERFETLPVAIAPIQVSPPDVLILADMDAAVSQGNTPSLPINLDIPVICIDSNSTFIKLITTIHVPASLSNLIRTINSVKKTPTIRREVT